MMEVLWPVALAIIAFLATTLVGVVGWTGLQIKHEIRTLSDAVRATNVTLWNIETDLRGKLAGLDRRMAVVEATCDRAGCGNSF